MITDILNIADIQKETYSIKSYFAEVTKVNDKTVDVNLSSRPGSYKNCSVVGYSFPKEKDKGVLMFIGGYNYPVFAKLFNHRTDKQSQFIMEDENSSIRIKSDSISIKSYQGIYTHFDTEAVKQGLVENVDFRYQTHDDAIWSDTTRRYARKEVIDALINLIKNWNVYINKDSKYLIGIGDLSKRTPTETAHFHKGVGHRSGRGLDMCNDYLCNVQGLNDITVKISTKLLEYCYRFGFAEFIIFNAPQKYANMYIDVSNKVGKEYSNTITPHHHHFHLSWVGGRVG